MKSIRKIPLLVVVHVLVLGSAGCTNNRTEHLALACQGLLEDSDRSNDRRFLREADAQLAALRKPPGRLEAFRRDIEDHDAMKFKQALEECVWQLKSRQ
jgi:hypothetical protein